MAINPQEQPSPAQEAIATLIELAQQGELDPWDVPVIDVIDRFLQELGLMDDENLSVERDLPRSGQTFLWASKLVALKADTLELLTNPPEPEPEPVLEYDLDHEQFRLPLKLENHLRRRAAAPPPRKRRVTLKELIVQIEEIAEEIGDLPQRKKGRSPKPYSKKEAAKTIVQLAHDENLTELAQELDRFLRDKLPPGQEPTPEVDLEQLVQWWLENQGQGKEAHREKVGIFWALLLLSSQSKVELWQGDFYQDVKIRPCTDHNPFLQFHPQPSYPPENKPSP